MAAPERLDPPTMARVAAREFFDGAVVNLGVGLPLACADYLPAGREVLLHSEQGCWDMGRSSRTRRTWTRTSCSRAATPCGRSPACAS